MKKTNFIGLLPLFLLTLTIISCEKDDFEINETNQSQIEETGVQSTNTILGNKLQIPFEVKNIQKAMENLSENQTSTIAKSKL